MEDLLKYNGQIKGCKHYKYLEVTLTPRENGVKEISNKIAKGKRADLKVLFIALL